MILLIDSARNFLERERKMQKPYPHCGMAYIGTYLETNGLECKIIDRNAYDLTVDDIANIVRKEMPVLVGFTAMTYNITDAYAVAEEVKKISGNIVTVVGGVHPTLIPEKTLNECKAIDLVIRGEGEISFKLLAESIENGQYANLKHTIPSLCYRENGKIIKNPLIELPLIFDDLPFPDWKFYQIDKYYRIYSEKFHNDINIFQINTSRGCPFTCTFCSPIHDRKVRYRTADSIVGEIMHNLAKFDARHFDFADSNATYRKDNFLKLCTKLVEKNLHKEISWNIDTGINIIDKEILLNAKQAGCEMISLGIESGSDFILKKMNKHYTADTAYDLIKIASEIGLKIKTSFILGHPYETLDTAYETFHFARKLRKNLGVEFYYNLVDVYPGTKLYTMVENQEGGARWIPGLADNWAKYQRTTPMIEVNELNREKLIQLYNEFNAQLLQISGSNFYENGKA